VISDPRIPAPPRTSHPIVLPFAFVPAVATSPARATRQVTQDMISSAGAGLFGSGSSPLAALAVAAARNNPANVLPATSNDFCHMDTA
jgi:hypothetical protein